MAFLQRPKARSSFPAARTLGDLEWRIGWVIRVADKEKKTPKPSVAARESDAPPSHLDEFFRSLQPGKPNAGAIAAATEAAERLAVETDAEQAAEDTALRIAADSAGSVCRACGHRNRAGNRFCGMCGAVIAESANGNAGAREEEPKPSAASGQSALETHHYHHHYHHHYLPGGYEAAPRGAYDSGPAKEERMRPNAALRGEMSRAEAAVRRITHEWVLACNTKHLDDLLDLYVADALVLRSNHPPVRGAAAVREFFFAALDAGLGDVEFEPLRMEVAGDLAYEAGRCKALVPGATGKRREERGKYLWVFARQNNGEWKLVTDCWSSDLSFTTLESDLPPSSGVKVREPRKGS